MRSCMWLTRSRRRLSTVLGLQSTGSRGTRSSSRQVCQMKRPVSSSRKAMRSRTCRRRRNTSASQKFRFLYCGIIYMYYVCVVSRGVYLWCSCWWCMMYYVCVIKWGVYRSMLFLVDDACYMYYVCEIKWGVYLCCFLLMMHDVLCSGAFVLVLKGNECKFRYPKLWVCVFNFLLIFVLIDFVQGSRILCNVCIYSSRIRYNYHLMHGGSQIFSTAIVYKCFVNIWIEELSVL